MKKRTRIILIIVAVIVGIIAYRVIRESISYTYRMQQPMENVECVKICYHSVDDPEELTTAAVMNAQEGRAFLANLLSIKCKYSHYNSVMFVAFESIHVEITYTDGQWERIGRNNNSWIDENGQIKYGGYYFPGEDFYNLLRQYA